MTPEALEALFIQREDLARRIIERIRDSALTPSKHHTILVGPRGIGKTHFVSLLYHRIRAMDDLRDRLLIAWLREEEWGVTSFLDLLLRIFRALVGEYSEVLPTERIESLYSLQSAAAERTGAALLKEFVGNRTLLVLIENLDDLFAGLGDKGQKRLRAYLQENPFCAILATSQSLFNGVSLQTSPFYGFFRIHHLEELTFEEATRLLASIANFEGDYELASFLSTPVGRARIRAVHHLAGGNHRVYVIFSQFLTRESLDEFVDPFMHTLDDLTPYYQARMGWLSPQQRKIVEFLCDCRHAAPVKKIAQRCFLTHQTTSSQLKTLRDMGYVRFESVGRESYYEVREPLMRLCIEIKKNRGEPIRLLVDFLRFWYSRTDLQRQLEGLQLDAALKREYLLHTLRATDEGTEDPRVAACLEDHNTYFEKGDFIHALKATEELIAIRGLPHDWAEQGYCLGHLGRWDEALRAFGRAIELDPTHAEAWRFQGWVLCNLKRYEDALASVDKAIELDPKDAAAWSYRGSALGNLGRHEDALASFNKAIKIDPKSGHRWLNQGRALANLGRYKDALASLDKAAELRPNNVPIWGNRGLVLADLGRHEEALASFDKLIQLDPEDAHGWFHRGLELDNLGCYEEALSSYGKSIELGEQSSFVNFRRAETLLKLHRRDESIAALGDALHHIANPDKSETSSVAASVAVVVSTLFSCTHDAETWKKCITALLALDERDFFLSALGFGLVESISALVSPTVGNVTARKWRDLWQEFTSERKEFGLPLHLLDATIRYRETHDQRVLLELPTEERKLLESLLKSSKIAPSAVQ